MNAYLSLGNVRAQVVLITVILVVHADNILEINGLHW